MKKQKNDSIKEGLIKIIKNKVPKSYISDRSANAFIFHIFHNNDKRNYMELTIMFNDFSLYGKNTINYPTKMELYFLSFHVNLNDDLKMINEIYDLCIKKIESQNKENDFKNTEILKQILSEC